jgi:hypothetical protein
MEVKLYRGADSIYLLVADDRQSAHFQRRNCYLLQSNVVRYLCHGEFKCSAHKYLHSATADLTSQDFPFRPHSTFICFLRIK